MNNVLLDTIKEVMQDWHIETGRNDERDKLCLLIENAISKKILSHEIDYYSEKHKALIKQSSITP